MNKFDNDQQKLFEAWENFKREFVDGVGKTASPILKTLVFVLNKIFK